MPVDVNATGLPEVSHPGCTLVRSAKDADMCEAFLCADGAFAPARADLRFSRADQDALRGASLRKAVTATDFAPHRSCNLARSILSE
jgi:hypothetical protein